MPPFDQSLMTEAHTAADRVRALEDQLESAKADYWRTIRRLHLAGASMRELAEALGISHQRVHQILEDGGVRRWRRRRREDPAAQRLCSFCGHEQRQVRKLVAGPGGVYICDPCIMAAVGVTSSGRPSKDPVLQPVPPAGESRCSFCGKPRDQVKTLVIAPTGEAEQTPAICDECLGLCGEILSEQLRKQS